MIHTDKDIEAQIAARNIIRSEAHLPRLGDQEMDRLRAARDNAIFEAVFGSQRHRFPEISMGSAGWLSRFGRWSQARAQVRDELLHGMHLDHALAALGFIPVDDHGHDRDDDDDVNDRHRHRRRDRRYGLSGSAHPLVADDLASVLAAYGWQVVDRRPASLRNIHTGDILNFEAHGGQSLLCHTPSAFR